MADSPGLFRLKQIFIRTLTIDHTQVPSTQSDFPVMVRLSHWTLRNEAHGGHVVRSDGFDIGFYSDAGITTKLKWEIERYDAGTGELVAHVKIASVSSVSDTVFYLSYGDPTITTDQSDPVNVWTNSYDSVYHLGSSSNTTSVLTLTDSLAGVGHTLINTKLIRSAGGQISNCAELFSARTATLTGYAFAPTALTYSIWANGASFPAAYNDPIIRIDAAGTSFNIISVKSTGKLRWGVKCTTQIDKDGTGVATLSVDTWYHLVLTYDSTSGLVGYVNASSDNTNAANGNVAPLGGESFDIGGSSLFGTQYWNGRLDEARFATVARSANWVTTEYNSQKPGSTFLTLGAET